MLRLKTANLTWIVFCLISQMHIPLCFNLLENSVEFRCFSSGGTSVAPGGDIIMLRGGIVLYDHLKRKIWIFPGGDILLVRRGGGGSLPQATQWIHHWSKILILLLHYGEELCKALFFHDFFKRSHEYLFNYIKVK